MWVRLPPPACDYMKKGLSIFLVVVLFLLILNLFLFFLNRGKKALTSDSYLSIRLSGPIPESGAKTFSFGKELTLRDIYIALQRGKEDPKIRACYLKISYPTIGWGEAEEIRRMISSFKKTGKKVISFVEFGSDLGYFIATSADKIYTLPGSYIELNGIGAERLYYKGFLDRIGITPQFFHIGNWKTAANSYIKKGMTKYEREQLERLGSGIMDFYLKAIENSRKMRKDEILSFMNEEGGGSGEDFAGTKFFDGIEGEEGVINSELKGLKPVKAIYYASIDRGLNPNRIAVVFADGIINLGSSGYFPLTGKVVGADTFRNVISKLRRDPCVRGVVLRVNSPGGSVTASEEMERAVKRLAEAKPVVVSMSSYAASGGYYISTDAKKIFANNLTLTGSIGVIGGKLSFKGALEKLGMNVDSVGFTKTALINSPYRAYTKEESSIVKKRMWSFYRLFVKRVAEGRRKSKEYIDSIGRGRVYLGKEAMEIGLIDGIGGLDDSIREAAKLSGTRFYSVEFYPKKKTLLERFINFLKNFDSSSLRFLLDQKVYFLVYPEFQFN